MGREPARGRRGEGGKRKTKTEQCLALTEGHRPTPTAIICPSLFVCLYILWVVIDVPYRDCWKGLLPERDTLGPRATLDVEGPAVGEKAV